ncbi:hypothetical protein TWF696_003228 [Orbilia brochopaga]|uniref:Uncharacterized protein n=1 Tax=Orbilia brochopaga TaxID=3140254 RepID=A0AAV9TXY4_9PEZI
MLEMEARAMEPSSGGECERADAACSSSGSRGDGDEVCMNVDGGGGEVEVVIEAELSRAGTDVGLQAKGWPTSTPLELLPQPHNHYDDHDDHQLHQMGRPHCQCVFAFGYTASTTSRIGAGLIGHGRLQRKQLLVADGTAIEISKGMR